MYRNISGSLGDQEMQGNTSREASVSTTLSSSAKQTIDYFTVVSSVTWPSDGGEAGVDLVLIQTSLLLLCKTSCSDAN